VDLELAERLQDARSWVNAAMRRSGAYVGALYSVAAADDPGKAAAVGDLVVAANDLLNSAVHAITAVERLGPLPAALDPMVKLLRNVHEHWDQTRETFVTGGPPKNRSGKAVAQLSDVSPWRFLYSNTPEIGVLLGPLSIASLNSVLQECASIVRLADLPSGWEPVVVETPELPPGLLALTVVGQLIHNPSLGLTIFQPILSAWDPEFHE
jgi:hypothetical protein